MAKSRRPGSRALTSDQEEDLFLAIWYRLSPPIYDELRDGIDERDCSNETMISELATTFPGLYRKVLDTMVEETLRYQVSNISYSQLLGKWEKET